MSRQPSFIRDLPGREQSRQRLRGIVSMIAGVFVFSIMDSLMKRVSEHYGPMQISCLRCLSSWLLLLPAIVWQRSWPTLLPRNLPLHLVRGVLGIGMLGGFVVAVHRLSLAQTYSLFLAAPLLMTALSVPIHGERVTVARWLAIAVGLSGVLVILQPWSKGHIPVIAALGAALATVCYSLSALTVRTLSPRNTNLSMVFWYLLLVGIGCGVLAVGDWRPIVSGDWPWFIGIGVSGALGQMWLTNAFRHAPPSVVGPFEYTSILWAFAIDWIFWSATPSAGLVIGAGIVITSGIFVIFDERRLAGLALTPASPPP